MNKTIISTSKQLELMEYLLKLLDPQIHRQFKMMRDFDTIVFISWLLTFFTLQTSNCRVLDAILCGGPDLALFIICRVIISEKEELLECEEFTDVYTVFKNLNWTRLDFDLVIKQALRDRDRFKVRYRRFVGRSSVLTNFQLFKNCYSEFNFEKVESLMEETRRVELSILMLFIAVGVGLYLKFN